MKLRLTLILLAITAALFVWGCSDDKPTGNNNNPGDTTSTNTTVWNPAGYWETRRLDASDPSPEANFTYYSFLRRDTVTLTDEEAAADTSWNIAFKRSNIILNGGVSGPENVDAVDLATLGNPDSTDFEGFNDLASIGAGDWVEDHINLMINDWYSYNPNDHSFSLTDYIYIMKDATGNYVKFKVDEMESPGQPPNMGTITIVYIFAGTSRLFSGTPDTLTFDASSGGPIYVDFSAGSITNPPDPMNSTDWDILFENYEIHQNNTAFGSGMAATYPVWQSQDDSTDFDETPEAPAEPQAYFPDQFASVLSDWYDYNPETHQLPSRNHVYVIRVNGSYFKMQIITYYDPDTMDSGYYTYRWLEL